MDKVHVEPDWGKVWRRTTDAIKEWQSTGGSPWIDVNKMRLIVHYSDSGISSDAFYPDGLRLVVNGYKHTTEQYLEALQHTLCGAAWNHAPSSLIQKDVCARSLELTFVNNNKFATRAAPALSNRAFTRSLQNYLATLDRWIAEEVTKNANEVQG